MSFIKHYILKGKRPVLTKSLDEWAEFIGGGTAVVAKTKIGKKTVSTVFLGINHSWHPGKLLLFETMVFPDCSISERYATWEEAAEGHLKIVAKIKDSHNKK